MQHDRYDAGSGHRAESAQRNFFHDARRKPLSLTRFDIRPGPRFGLGMAALRGVSVLTLASVMNLTLASADPLPSAQRQRELVRFVRQECGFCHGLRLTGGLGSPLTPQALAEKPREALEATILYGRTGTAMPGWMPHLSERDAQWIVTELLKGFPE